jgi:hypothetical protein
VIQLVRWKTDSAPAAGERQQAIINGQALDTSDILVGIFWSRFGSPTGVAESGTEEEIHRSVSLGRRDHDDRLAAPAALARRTSGLFTIQ